MRNTPLLESVLKILSDSPKPLSVPDLQICLKAQSLKPNKTTLYRMLEKLVEKKEVEALLLDPKIIYYERSQHHHHHFICYSCQSIECLDVPELEKKIHEVEDSLNNSGHLVSHHQFSLSGRCTNCQ